MVLVLITELLNSGIDIDRIGPELRRTVQARYDMGSAAVLLSLLLKVARPGRAALLLKGLSMADAAFSICVPACVPATTPKFTEAAVAGSADQPAWRATGLWRRMQRPDVSTVCREATRLARRARGRHHSPGAGDKELANLCDELHVVTSMHGTCAMMVERSDAFLAPRLRRQARWRSFVRGLTWRQLGYHDSSAGPLDTNEHYGGSSRDPLRHPSAAAHERVADGLIRTKRASAALLSLR